MKRLGKKMRSEIFAAEMIHGPDADKVRSYDSPLWKEGDSGGPLERRGAGG